MSWWTGLDDQAKIDAVQVVVTSLIGVAGFFFVWQQNEILKKQNELMSNQYHLNNILIRRELDADSNQEIDSILRNIYLGRLANPVDLDRDIESILDKGLIDAEIKNRFIELFKQNLPGLAMNVKLAEIQGSLNRIGLKAAQKSQD